MPPISWTFIAALRCGTQAEETLSAGYSESLAAVGGLEPYSWPLADEDKQPAGLELSTSGVISGTLSVVTARDFLYEFDEITFTNAGQTARSRPSLAQVQAAYASVGDWTQNTDYLDVDAGIQLWTVPETARYEIRAIGASGGKAGSSRSGGRGTVITDTLLLERGAVIRILVGQMGEGTPTPATGCVFGAGGGGGTFVVDHATGEPLLVAGGGGGAASSFADEHSSNASLTTTGEQGGEGGGAGGTNGGGSLAGPDASKSIRGGAGHGQVRIERIEENKTFTLVVTDTGGRQASESFTLVIRWPISITTCAIGDACEVGDIGPGGDIVFYVHPNGGTLIRAF